MSHHGQVASDGARTKHLGNSAPYMVVVGKHLSFLLLVA